MCDGEIVQSGDYEELLKLGLDFGALVEAHNQHYGWLKLKNWKMNQRS
jgi:hypothetical protein